jgi:hypothetical protein
MWLRFLRLSSWGQNFVVLTSRIWLVRTDWLRQFLQYLSLFWQNERNIKSEIICQNLNHQISNTILKIIISKTYIVAKVRLYHYNALLELFVLHHKTTYIQLKRSCINPQIPQNRIVNKMLKTIHFHITCN